MKLERTQFSIFSGSSHPLLAKEIADLLGLPLGKSHLNSFPDGEISFEILESVKNRDVYILQTLALEPNFYLMELLIMIDAMKRASAKTITAIVPYFCYARQDRQDKPGVPITAKLISNLLVQAGASQIIAMDLHSQQIEGFFDIPVINLLSRPTLVQICTQLNLNQPIVVAPDLGSLKLARAFAEDLGAGLVVMDKQRIHASQVNLNFFLGDVKNRDVVIVDDMCSTGATIVSAANACKKEGAQKVYAAITHGLCVGQAMQELEKASIETLLITNTIPYTDRLKSKMKVTVVSIADSFAKFIN
jgi:ribose-phosphate pyrophosphokinase